jgi:diguanylate cyclase (GGDEF)-like protein/PAS domain S-box-containing protein
MDKAFVAEDDSDPLPSLAGVDGRFRTIFDSVNDGIFISDPATGRFIDINEPGCKMFGYPKVELIGKGVDALSSGIHPHTQDMAIELNEKARLGEPQIFEWQCKTKEGVLFSTEISLRYTELDHAPAIVAVIRDISERKRLDAAIVYMAQHDVLTGLPNRAMFTTALDRTIALSLRAGKKFAVLYLDLDQFKDVNDTRGHLIGDRLLRVVAERLQAGVRRNEDVARFGGDEFAILLADVTTPEEIAALAYRLILSISKPVLIDGDEIFVGASIGVSIFDEDAHDAETLLSHADIALYRAKAEGRQTYRFFSDAMNEAVRSRVKLTDELRLAIQNEQLFLVYQPQVRAKGGRIIGVEALVRWQHPDRGIIMPKDFLPVAESSGLITPLGYWVLHEACRQGRQWIDAGITPGIISVNLSTAEFKSPLAFERKVFSVLAETGLPPSLLELEITENTLISFSSQHEEVIKRLRSAGVRFSLDDFGTGYSSLSYLRRFSIDRIKIAQDFISDLATSAESASIVKLILGLSRDFGSEVIAEGVETQQQLSLLQDLSCPDVQGYYFSPPMSAESIVPLLSAGTIIPSKSGTASVAA